MMVKNEELSLADRLGLLFSVNGSLKTNGSSPKVVGERHCENCTVGAESAIDGFERVNFSDFGKSNMCSMWIIGSNKL